MKIEEDFYLMPKTFLHDRLYKILGDQKYMQFMNELLHYVKINQIGEFKWTKEI